MNNSSHVPTGIVTGGSKGLGRAIARALAARGWQLVIDGRDGRALQRAAAETGAIALAGDVTSPAHRAELVNKARSLTGQVDLLVNNASSLGQTPLPPLGQYDLGALREVLEANVVAPLALVQLALPLLRACGGAVINVSSDAAVEAYAGWGGYGASKAALEQLSNVLAVEEPSVAVWWFDPGDMRTDMHQAAFPDEDISDRPEPSTAVPAVLDLLQRRPPSGRVRAADVLAEVLP